MAKRILISIVIIVVFIALGALAYIALRETANQEDVGQGGERIREQSVAGSSGEGLIEKLSLEELVGKADTILIGTVREIASEWTCGTTAIYTYVKIYIEDLIKGREDQSEGEVTIIAPGGRADDVSEEVSTAARFALNEKVLLFLKDEGVDNYFTVIGGFQGKYTIVDDKILEFNIFLNKFVKEIREIMKRLNIAAISPAPSKGTTPPSQEHGRAIKRCD